MKFGESMRRSLCAAVLAVVAAQGTHAAESVSGRVLEAGTFGSGRLFVRIDVPINEPGCAGSRFDVPATHPQAKNWLAIALAASASGKRVVVHTNGCWNGMPTMSENTDAWFYIE